MRKALLLNRDWSPLSFVSDRKAVSLLHRGRATVVSLGEKPSTWPVFIRSVSGNFEVPATICLTKKISRKFTDRPKFRKRALYNRDDWTCQYCHKPLTTKDKTIDHVFPRARGGRTEWENCVASCKSCNMLKGSRTPSEAGMLLRVSPGIPKITDFWDAGARHLWHPDWLALMPDFYSI